MYATEAEPTEFISAQGEQDHTWAYIQRWHTCAITRTHSETSATCRLHSCTNLDAAVAIANLGAKKSLKGSEGCSNFGRLRTRTLPQLPHHTLVPASFLLRPQGATPDHKGSVFRCSAPHTLLPPVCVNNVKPGRNRRFCSTASWFCCWTTTAL